MSSGIFYANLNPRDTESRRSPVLNLVIEAEPYPWCEHLPPTSLYTRRAKTRASDGGFGKFLPPLAVTTSGRKETCGSLQSPAEANTDRKLWFAGIYLTGRCMERTVCGPDYRRRAAVCC
jgi:hypothetical protein